MRTSSHSPPRRAQTEPDLAASRPRRRIAFGPEHLQQSEEAPFRQTEPGTNLHSRVAEILAPKMDPLRPRERIGQYELIRELGRGAMGRVFLARDTKLGRRVAIKFLNAGHLGDRFMVEARTTAKCAHENIVVIHDVSEHQGRPYMVLEYLQGQPLRDLIGRPLPAHRAVELIIPVVRAMVHAHESGIVHRDLKPDNIFVTASGTIKVLDFGIAKLLDRRTVALSAGKVPDSVALDDTAITHDGVILGTMPYMSPEQWLVRDHNEDTDQGVDHRSDVWAVGVILYELLCGRHPLAPLSRERLQVVRDLDMLMPEPSVRVPGELARIIKDCLEKRKTRRIASARELLDQLQGLELHDRRLGTGESPYAGLTAFQEKDSHRFFGRTRDIARLVARVEEQPMVAVVGPTGVGKSSLIRAGVVPALKRSGDVWDVHTLRPGRYPLAGLANLAASVIDTPAGDSVSDPVTDTAAPRNQPAIIARLREQPGYLGTLLRNRARRHCARALIFVDQFEELYTLVENGTDRRLFLACLAAIADDAEAPLRVILSMRSDFLERVAEDREFMDLLVGSLVLLAPPEREGLKMALVQPAQMAGYEFEAPLMVERMLDALDKSQAALPLLQFTASRLWDARARDNRLLTLASYRDMGGVAGALASHADDVIAGLSVQSQKLARAIFERLVTPERTRAIASVADLCQMSGAPGSARALIDHLVRSRLLVANQARIDHAAGDGPTVEIVHESLIEGWPTLREWLDEDAEKARFLAQLRVVGRQWHDKGRPNGMLWRGKSVAEAKNWHGKLDGELTGVEKAYLDAVVWLADRSIRTRRLVMAAVLSVLVAIIAAAAVALLWIKDAEQKASLEALKAQQEMMKARDAETKLNKKVRELKRAKQALEAANSELALNKAELEQSQRDLKNILARLQESLANSRRAEISAQRQSKLAEQETEKAKDARMLAEASAEAERITRGQKEAVEEELKQRQQRVEDYVGLYTKELN